MYDVFCRTFPPLKLNVRLVPVLRWNMLRNGWAVAPKSICEFLAIRMRNHEENISVVFSSIYFVGSLKHKLSCTSAHASLTMEQTENAWACEMHAPSLILNNQQNFSFLLKRAWPPLTEKKEERRRATTLGRQASDSRPCRKPANDSWELRAVGRETM